MVFPRDFGPYHLIEQIAMGGMAEIVLAKTKGFGGFEKLLALKMIHPKLAEDRHFINMLIEEAKICVELSHANICQVFDLGRIGDTHYLAMEFVEGVDVFKMMRRATEIGYEIPIEACVHIGQEICAGLDYAHTKRDSRGECLGIIHRDISPQNILVAFSGEVKIVDFGIAKAGLRAKQTEVGVIKGKYYYMSPEQAWADPVDHRTDIFSTGIILYEVLTGQMLYLEENIELLLDRVRKAEIAPPSSLRPEIPKQLDAIVMKALAKYPDDRYQSAIEMGHALGNFLYLLRPDYTSAHLAAMMAWLFDDLVDADERIPEASTAEIGSLLLTREDFVKRQPDAAGSLVYDLADLEETADSGSFSEMLADFDTTAQVDLTGVEDERTARVEILDDLDVTAQVPVAFDLKPFSSADTQAGPQGWDDGTGDETHIEAATDIQRRLASQLTRDTMPRAPQGRKPDEDTRVLAPFDLRRNADAGSGESPSYQPPPPPGFSPGSLRRPSQPYQPPSPTTLGTDPAALRSRPQHPLASDPPGGEPRPEGRAYRSHTLPLPQVTDPRGIQAPPVAPAPRPRPGVVTEPAGGRKDDTKQLSPDALRSVQARIFGPESDIEVQADDLEPSFDDEVSSPVSPFFEPPSVMRGPAPSRPASPGPPRPASSAPPRSIRSAPSRPVSQPSRDGDDSAGTNLTAYVPHPAQVGRAFESEDDAPTSMVQNPSTWTRSAPETDLLVFEPDSDESQPTVVIPDRHEVVDTKPTDMHERRRPSVEPVAPQVPQPFLPAHSARPSQPAPTNGPARPAQSGQPAQSVGPSQPSQLTGPSPPPRASGAPPWMMSGEQPFGGPTYPSGAPEPPWPSDPEMLDEEVLEAPPDLDEDVLLQRYGLMSLLKVLVPVAAIAAIVAAVYFLWPLWGQPEPRGRLDIRSHPAGARVVLDGQPLAGLTPVSISDLEIGSVHQVELQLDGFVPWTQPVEIGHNEVRQIAILRPILGTLQVTSEPAGASVSLDGVYQGTTPCEVEELDINRDLRVQLRYQGQSQTRDFSWQGQTEATLHFDFEETSHRRSRYR